MNRSVLAALLVLASGVVGPLASAESVSAQAPAGPVAPLGSPGASSLAAGSLGARADGCGMTEADATFRELAAGSVVTLQRHRWVRGEANWRDEMNRYVGRAARVTRLSGVDAQGCSGVRVDIDREQYFWRVRDLGIGTGPQRGEEATAAGASGGFPQECRMAEGRERYGAAAAGVQVVLGRHRAVDGDTNWSDEMGPFVGRTARIVGPAGIDGSGCPGVRVDIDSGSWFWRIRDLRPAGGGVGGDLASLTLVPSAGITTDHGRPAVSTIGGGSGLFGAGGAPGPQACGLTDQSIQWEGLAVGVEVMLGRHRVVNGDDNWDTQMDAFVGRTGHITELIGVDDQGCPLVHVDADNGQWFWRARDLVITQPAAAAAAPPAAPAPPVAPRP